jgi:hypothetical protein
MEKQRAKRKKRKGDKRLVKGKTGSGRLIQYRFNFKTRGIACSSPAESG